MVILAKAGIQFFYYLLDTRLRGYDRIKGCPALP